MLNAFRRSLFASTALLALGASAATAQNYEGNYQVRFGAYLLGGKASGNAEVAPATLPPELFAPTLPGGTVFDYSNGIYGVGVSGGLEWLRRGAWTWGVEIDGAALSGSSTFPSVNSKIGFDYLATVRARGGLYLRHDVVWYGTVGVAFLGTEAKTGSLKVSSTQTGLALGTGLEYDFGGGLLFAEYLYTGFGEIEASTLTTRYLYDADLHTFRVGVKFKVGHDWYHDDVAARTGRPLK
jgi:opacity protein-like surface antigen